MRNGWRLQAGILDKFVRRLLAWVFLTFVLVFSAATTPLWAEKSQPTEKGGGTTTSVVDEVAAVLRDESKSADERVKEALRLLEEGKTKGAAVSDQPPCDSSQVDRLPWLDDDWDQPSWTIPFGRNWDPWREMQEMRARMDRMFQQAWRRMTEQSRHMKQLASTFSPMGEFEERDNAYIYRFDLPGVDKNDVKVTVENGRLTVEGKRESRVDESRKGMTRREIFFGQFRRDLILPPDADTNNAKTKLENGVLTIELPRLKSNSTSTKRELKVQ
ncbi:MAG: Hsp20 family protein [Candidatus Sumerlaeaceae bacterium]|nr:Hsp20 family protein [Candidatus Sumerlaeaceae bacterium]